MTIYGFKDFNNYYNRKVKGQNLSTITEFIDTFGEFYYIQTDTYGNFSERDGIVTSHILGTQGNPYFGECDYLLVCDDNNNITSRWFIIDQDMKMYGQFTVNLYRDVVADNWSNIITAPMFIEKATLLDSDPLIFNQENVALNQIKKHEKLIKDESNCAWLIAYLNKDYDPEGNYINLRAGIYDDKEVSHYSDIATTIGYPSSTNYRKLYSSVPKFYLYKTEFDANARKWFLDKMEVTIENNQVSMTRVSRSTNLSTSYWCFTNNNAGISDSQFKILIQSKIGNSFSSQVKTKTETDLAVRNYNSTALSTILSYEKSVFKVLLDDNNTPDVKYWRIITYLNNVNALDQSLPVSSLVRTYITDILDTITHTGTDIQLVVNLNEDVVHYTTGIASASSPKVNLGNTADSRIHCRDMFDLICIPYADNVKIINTADTSAVTPNFTYTKEIALTLMQSLVEQLGSNIYDAQLVPYCPMTGLNFSTTTVGNTVYNVVDINSTDSSRFKFIVNDVETQKICVLLFSASNKGSKDIAVNYLPVTNKKLQNQIETVRLSSPNYTAQFDFNVARNNGVNYFNVDYNYLPYRPYIHVAPIWNADGLYGKDFNDAKGLICGGDFSISYLSDAWTNYQVQNKNFEEIFNRGTQHLDTEYKAQIVQSGISGAVGSLSGALTGGATGMMVGGPVAGAIGAAAGLGLSATGAIVDLTIQQNLHNEAMDYRKDLFELQLDNIKALPDTIKKVTAINENNKIWPFVEIYECTDREKYALAEKIAWNGMTVGVIGKMEDYLGNSWHYDTIYDKGYIKGQLIRAEGICDDTHMLNAIADELNKGVYTK